MSSDKLNNSLELEDLEKRTRFQVNRVDASSAKNNGELEKLCDDEDDVEVRSRRGTLDQEDGRPISVDGNNYDTRYAKSFRHLTREALPRLDNYRNIMSIQAAYRPTLDELHNATLTAKSAGTIQKAVGGAVEGEGGVIKFGWVTGVLMRCLLNIWGVMLFLRLTWVVGEAGVAEGILLILSTTVVTSITALSMSAISTNGEIKGGGTYFMISRSLGPEFGGSIGLIFSLANAVACAMYVVGFCESLQSLFATNDIKIVDGGTQDIRIVGSITMLLLTGIVVIGMEWEAKAQFVLLVILLVAIGDFFIGAFIGPLSEIEQARGFTGLSVETFYSNIYSDYRNQKGEQHNFFSVFAIFFPAATGILAGANISGDLKDPQTAIPKGTILSIFITSGTYILMAVFAGAVVVRDASGNVSDLVNGTYSGCSNQTCQYGLQNDFQVVEMIAAFGPLIYAGCFAATLSSALASLVSAPKVFQALCKDRLYPYIFWFSKGYGKNNEPARGYVLTFIIAIVFILIGKLDAIAPLISNFFLAAYALINFSTFHASLAKPVGWRPTFKFYSMWLSLLGSLLCVAVMFLISWSTALITLGVVVALYLIVSHRKPDVNWGSTTQAQTYKNALTSVQQLNYVEDHVKNYRPQILVLSGMPNYRPPLIDFAFLLTKNLSLLICGHILKSTAPQRVRNALTYKAHSWLRAHKIKAFYSHVDESSFEEGAKALIQASGIGKLRPNILLMGYKNDWLTCDSEDLSMYFNTMHKALDLHMAVAVLRVEGGLDFSKILCDGEEPRQNGNIPQVPSAVGMSTAGSFHHTHHNSQESLSIPHNQSFSQLSTASSVSDLSTPPTPNMNKSRISGSPNADDTDQTVTPEHEEKAAKKDKKKRDSRADLYKGAGDAELSKDVLNSLTRFQRKQKKGTIDVWWLYDDGGLTLLLPYIITTRGNWSDCKLRVFTLANKTAELEYEQRSMASLLAKFRIDYSALKLIPDITKKPKDSTVSFFEDLITPFKIPESEEENDSNQFGITEADLLAMKDKTNRHLRLRELLLEHSADANLIVMTLPMPRKNVVSAPLYMAWLEVLTRDMPPFVLVRGNQTSVLTFYS